MTLFQAFGQFASSGAVAEVPAGMELVIPTSATVTGSGSSGTLTNGTYSFISAETITLNGVFSATYDNYTLVISANVDSLSSVATYQLTSAGTPNTTSTYSWQAIRANNTTVDAELSSLQTLGRYGSYVNNQCGHVLQIYYPYQAQATTVIANCAYTNNGGFFDDYWSFHTTASSFDGIKLMLSASRNMGGKVSVYGYRKAAA